MFKRFEVYELETGSTVASGFARKYLAEDWIETEVETRERREELSVREESDTR